jgi:hypothetical protein
METERVFYLQEGGAISQDCKRYDLDLLIPSYDLQRRMTNIQSK